MAAHLMPSLLLPSILRFSDSEVRVPVAVQVAAQATQGPGSSEDLRVCVDAQQVRHLGNNIVAGFAAFV